MSEFPCPMCGAARESADADCGVCDWVRNAAPEFVPAANCPLCGGLSYTWGRIEPPTIGGQLNLQHGLRFLGSDSSLLDLLGCGERVRARKCDNCGNLQLFAVDG